MSSRSPAVEPLQVHLENHQVVLFEDGQERQAAAAEPRDTPLTAWMRYNRECAAADPGCLALLYPDFPRHCRWDKGRRNWVRRQNHQAAPTIGRVVSVSPRQGDVFYLRLLLHHVPGATSFAELRTVAGVVCATHQEACRRRGLLQEDAEWDVTMQEAALVQMPRQLRQLLVTILLFCEPADPAGLFERHYPALAEDFTRRHRELDAAVARSLALLDVERRLQRAGKELADLQLPVVPQEHRLLAAQLEEAAELRRLPPVIQEELAYDREALREQTDARLPTLLPSQRAVVDAVLDAVRERRPLAVLEENMRARQAADGLHPEDAAAFCEWLLALGEGRLPTDDDGNVQLPAGLCMDADLPEVIRWVFGRDAPKKQRQAELERRRAQREADEEQRAADAERLRRLREDEDYRERERQRQQQRQLDEANRERERQRQQQRQLDEANRERDRDRADRRRRERRDQSPSREARHTAAVLSGEQAVPLNTVGDRDRGCQHCGALLWPAERPSLCCAAGKVRLAPLPAPPPSLRQLWTDDSAVARIFRKHVRHLNSALALASQTVQEVRPPPGHGGYTPSVVIQGRLYHRLGPLRARDGEVPKFAQIYVQDPLCEDPEAEAALRLGHVRLSANTPAATQRALRDILQHLQQLLREHNPLVQDFIMASEIPEDQVEHRRLVISADARPAGEHARRYNRPEGLQEVSVLIGEEPVHRDIVLRRRAAGDGADLATIMDDDSLLRACRLLQEFCCMAFARVETQRLLFLAMNQRQIRAELYQHLVDAMAGDLEDAAAAPAAADQPARDGAGDAGAAPAPPLGVGRRVILPPSFIGGPRHMQTSEACWRLFQFDMSSRSPAVEPLQVHLENHQVVLFEDGQERQAAAAEPRDTPLTAWMRYNRECAAADPGCLALLYPISRGHCRWDKGRRNWVRRQNHQAAPTIGRVRAGKELADLQLPVVPQEHRLLAAQLEEAAELRRLPPVIQEELAYDREALREADGRPAAHAAASPLWRHFHYLRLEENMRARQAADGLHPEDAAAFCEWLLALGEGRLPTDDDGNVQLPAGLCMDADLPEVIRWVFGDLRAAPDGP
ncbi:hypothetical protein FJT64_014988 [Amphibalanus amphitrite]|uniref:ATP-dependent DNA helicase n=1 Tax=Amphibalanus amphitrite TaxID=1232801 RepID=A0A6A4XGJ7_AMPAM|nr:hypothetical protein FJT64_014988 [Amphibalanus amphitrite]